MPITSTAFNACDAVIHMADHNGVTRDISGSANEVNLDLNNEIGDYKVFGEAARYRLVCGEDGALSLKVWFSQGTNEAAQLLLNWRENNRKQARYFAIFGPNESVGSHKFSGYFVLESMSVPFSAEEAAPIAIDANLLPSGPIDWSIQAT